MRVQNTDTLLTWLRLLLLAVAGSLLVPGYAAETASQVQAELEAVTTAIADIQSWLDTASSSYSSEEARLREAEVQLATTSSQVRAIQTELRQTQQRQDALQQQSQALEADKEQQQALLQQLLRAAYMRGDRNLLQLLLNQEDPGESARMLHYYRRYSESQLETLQRYQATLAAISVTNTDLLATAAELTQQQSELQLQIAALEQRRQARELALDQLQARIAARSSELEQLQSDQAQLQALVEEINRAIERMPPPADAPPFSEQRGRLALPVAGRVVSQFGARYGDGNLRRQGLSIAAPEGTAVQAVHAGRVVFADWLRGAGLLVIIDHGNGYMSLYGNNQALAISAGDWVNRGETVATAGSPANPGEGALYFEIRQHGAPLNPADWLERTD